MMKEIAGVVRINPEGQPRFCPSDMGTDAFTVMPGDKLVLKSGAKVKYLRGDEGEEYPTGRLLESASLPGLPNLNAGEQLIFTWAEVCGAFPPERPTPELKIGLIEPEFELPDAWAVSAPDLLNQAAKHMADRAATYDKPGGERSMAQTVQAFNAIRGTELTEAEGWLLLTLLKFVRDNQRQQPHRDSVEDAIAYAALYGEARLQEGVAP